MPAHSSIVTNLPGADLNSSAGPKGGGQDARNKVRQGTPYRRLATNSGEKCGLEGQVIGNQVVVNPVIVNQDMVN